jgi:hypothetical protein
MLRPYELWLIAFLNFLYLGVIVLLPTLFDPERDCEYILRGRVAFDFRCHNFESNLKMLSRASLQISLIYKFQLITGSTGIVLGYCKDDDITISVNATASPTARLPLPKFRT